MLHFDKNGHQIKEGMYLVSDYNEMKLRFIYYVDSENLASPYIYRQVENGPLEPVGRANKIDLDNLCIMK
jgi:hypothetical protein